MSAVDVEIVRAGILRYKHLNQSARNVLEKARSPKELWFVFRAGKGSQDRVLEYYLSERDFHKKPPKDRISLLNSQSVQLIGGEPKGFSITSGDGSVHTFESQTPHDAKEWVFALNAVLFGKGSDGRNIVRFYIEVWSCPQFRYSGPGILEVRDDQVIVWSQNETCEVVRWKMGHIRSFKAKLNHQLQINAGSRSTTGEGIFVFGTQESILITHTLETVIKNLAKKKASKPPQDGKRVPPTPPPPYQAKWTQETLVRGRTDTKDQVPGFTDVPGMRGPNKSTTEHHEAHPPSNPRAGDYDVLRSDNFLGSTENLDEVRNDGKPTIYGELSAYERLTAVPTEPKRGRTSNRRPEYQYTDTIPQLLPIPHSDTMNTEEEEFGEVRHVRSRNNSPRSSRNNSREDLTKISDEKNTYASITTENYAFLKPVEMPASSAPPGLYDSLNFQEGEGEEEHVTPRQPPRVLKINPSGSHDYDTLSPVVQLRKTEASSYDSLSFKGPVDHTPPHETYSMLSPENPNQPPLVPPRRKVTPDRPSYDRVTSPLSPLPQVVRDIEILYEQTDPQVQHKPGRQVSPRVSPVMQRRIYQEYDEIKLPQEQNDYDDVALDETDLDHARIPLPTAHPPIGEYSRFNRFQESGREVEHESLPYSHLSYKADGQNSEENAPYNTLVHDIRHSELFDDRDYFDATRLVVNEQYSTSKSPGKLFDKDYFDPPPTNNKPEVKTRPPVPPRVKAQPSTSKTHNAPTESQQAQVLPPKPKPKPKPKKNIVAT